VPAGNARDRYRRHRRKGDVLAKEALMERIDIHELRNADGQRDGSDAPRAVRQVNALGIGAQGLGGLSTVLDVKILDYRRTRIEPVA